MANRIHIRELSTCEIERIDQIDCSSVARARYVCERDHANSLCLSLRRQGIDPPIERPDWGTQERQCRYGIWRRNIEQDGCVMFGALEEDRLVGIAMAGPLADGITAELCTLYVHRPCRRHGIGRALMDRAESQCIEWGRSQLLVYTSYDAGAVDFYLSRSYRIVGIQDPCVQTKNFPITMLGRPKGLIAGESISVGGRSWNESH